MSEQPFNFTKDLLESINDPKEKRRVELELTALKQATKNDPTGLIDPEPHRKVEKYRKMAVLYKAKKDQGFPPGWDLDAWEYRMLNLVEEYYWTVKSGFPTIDQLIFYKPELEKKRKQLTALYNKTAFFKALEKRGIEIPVYDEDEEGNPRGLSPQQLMAANFMLNLHDTRTDREKLKELGISSHKWHSWLQDPVFSEYLRKRAENLYGSHDHAAYAGLIRAVENGDMQAIKFFFEMRGIYNPKMEVQVNVQQVLTRVVEVISLHVKDSNTLSAIAADLSAIEG